MKIHLVLLFLFLYIYGYSQDKIPFIDVDEIAVQVTEASQNGDYEKAVEFLDKISENDSTYISVLVSKSYYQMALKQFDKAIETIDKGLASKCGDLKSSFYQNKSAALINQKKYTEALEHLNQALEFFPKNHMLNYNRAVSLENLGKIEEAVKAYETTIILNPFYKKAYRQLGNICYKQERISQALMCFNMLLLLEPDADGAFKVINSINNLVSAKNENKRVDNVQISVDDEAFDDIDLILSNRIALNKNYKIDNEINVALVKQNHVMLDQLKDFRGNGGFWDTKFVPFYKWILNEDHFDDFVYTTMYSIENKKFKKTIEKNTKKIIAFIDVFRIKWAEIVQVNKIDWQGEQEEVTFYHDDYLKAVGKMENEITLGYWEFFNSSGRLTGAGNFNNKGNRDGKWIWYNQFRKIKETAFYIDGKLEGENNIFYENGNAKSTSNYSKDLLDGEYRKYNDKGALLEKKQFKNDKLEGLFTSYFKVGEEALEYHIPYKNDMINEKAFEYYANGDVFAEMSFSDGKRNGLEKKYHSNKKLYAEINYRDGSLNGSYKTFYSNGNALDVGQSVDGYFDGPWKTYYRDGTIQSDFSYSKGNQDGLYTYYDTDGKQHYEYMYRKGEIIAYKFYDKEGAIIKEAKKKGGEFTYLGYAPNGNKTAEGLYDISGGKMGDWKFYSSNGIMTESGAYTDNLTQGEYIQYYKNGKPESISNYKNDSLTGYYKSFHKNEKLASQGWYKEGELHGKWHNYYIDGTIKIINFYHSGQFHGEQKYFGGDGKLYRVARYNFDELISDYYYDQKGIIHETIPYNTQKGKYTILTHYTNNATETSVDYVNGVKHGSYVYHDFYGNKRTTGSYLNGQINDTLTWYYKDGGIESTVNYVNGDRHGDYRSYYENGQLERKSVYENGRVQGAWTNYYEDGTVDTISVYENDEYHGRREFFSPTGKLQLVRFYQHGRLIGYSYLGKDSVELPMIPIVNETVKITAYYDNGKVSRELEYKNGDVINGYNTYYYNGQLENEMTYDQHVLNGLDTEYYSDGTMRSQEPYIHGDLHGTVKEFHANGNLKKETTYFNDNEEGESKSYDINGKLTRIETYFNGDIISSETK